MRPYTAFAPRADVPLLVIETSEAHGTFTWVAPNMEYFVKQVKSRCDEVYDFNSAIEYLKETNQRVQVGPESATKETEFDISDCMGLK